MKKVCLAKKRSLLTDLFPFFIIFPTKLCIFQVRVIFMLDRSKNKKPSLKHGPFFYKFSLLKEKTECLSDGR